MTSSRSARRRRRADRRRALRADGKPPSDLRLECELPVEFVAAGEDDGQPKVRRFKMTAYSGGTMRPRGFFRDAVLDLTGVKVLGGNRPVLLGHDHSKIVGHTEQVEVNKRITAEGLVSGAGEAAREVTASADNGFPWRASVGGDIQETEFVAEGQTVLVNGRRFRGPLTVIRKATIAEISFVPIAGDDRTNAKIAASRNRGDVSVDFQKWLEARGLSEEQLSEEQLKQFRADWQAEKRRLEARRSLADELDRLIADRTTDDLSREEVLDQIVASAGLSGETLEQLLEASIDLPSEVSRKDLLEAAKNDDTPRSRPAPARPEEDYRRRIAAEDRRIEAVRALCARYGDPQIPLEGSGEQVNLRAHAIEHNWSLEKVELHAMRYTRPRVPAGHSADHTPRAGVLEAALCLSAGMPEKIVAQGLSEQEVDRATSREARSNATLHALMDTVILAAGGYYTGNRKSNDFIRAAMRAEKQLMAGRSYSSLQASNGFSTISLSGILGNTANKAMLAAYEAVETVHQLITAPRNQSDFKVWTRYRLDSTGAFKKVGADGELKHVGLDEGSYTNQLDTYGAIIALTRQMMINDDLDAFMQIPTILGRMSAVRLEEAVFVLLLSNPSSFFSTDNRNYFDGADSALSITSLTTAEQKFRDQVDSNGKPILVMPKILLTGTTDAVTAKELHDETKVDVTTSANKRQFASNPHAGKYEPAASPYLNNTAITDSDGNAITGQSDTQWYLFADPAVRAAMGVATLNGQRVPTIETDESSFDTLGMEWRGYHDFGVGMEDTVGSVKSKGAA